MKTLLRVATPVALVVLAAAVMLPSAQAACPSARVIGPATVGFYTPGNPFPGTGSYGPYTVTPDFKGVFWSFGTAPGGGDPALGLGNDSGSIQQNCWIYASAFGYPARFDEGACSHWNAVGVDGCIDGDGTDAASDPAQCMVALFTDDDDAGGSFFALASVGPDAGENYNFGTATGGADIILAPTPKPNITGSLRDGPNSVALTVNVQPGAGPAGGYYLACQQAALTAGARYRIYTIQTPRDSGAPTGDNSRDLANWTLESRTASGIPIGTSTTVTVTCGGVDLDFYLCSTLLFPAGNGNFYELANCSRDATKVECGPNLAEPGQPGRPRPSTGRLPSPGSRRR